MISNRRAAIEDAGMRSHRNRAGFPGICFIAIVHRAASAAGRELKTLSYCSALLAAGLHRRVTGR